MERGYLKLWRKSLDSEVFASEQLWILWTWCLMKASHKDRYVKFQSGKGGQSVHVLPGQFVFGRNKAAEVFGWSPSTTWNRLQKLADISCLSIESNNQYSIVSICNWKIYQSDEDEKVTSNGQATDKQLATDEQPIDTNKNVKNEENVKKKKEDNHPPCPHQKIIEVYNIILPQLSAVIPSLWNGQRSLNLQSRWKEDPVRQNIGWWTGLFEQILEMPFLLGKNEKGWAADLGWIVKQSNLVKILEGKYYQKVKGEKTQSQNLSPRDKKMAFLDAEQERIEEGIKNGTIDFGFSKGGNSKTQFSLPE